ncbi:ubiquinol oxidase subunit II [Amaricoccus sp.]|uniref:ubiquinol oxidase subunit II n=1 Tax=Amaricoccus sp. TaxID=1872485 RepID=UPI001B407655|nr:ubiquinol oxidase subunit II [Amaricoccus sp.]MBP7242716.1 ubiquinol oxidase subunit II [Amaricoccus sp.]
MQRTTLLALLAAPILAGCDMVVLSPSGHIAARQRDLLISSTLLMLVIVIPVMVLTAFFAWRYSARRGARYEPNWSHSTGLELLIWTAPLMIIICIGAITWVGTHLLDPFRPLEHIGERRPVPANETPLEIEVVALDWKWLFIYPEYGVATVNDAAAPIDRPIRFKLTASSVMNAFYVPALAGMIYAMPAMESQLNAVINVPGDYEGFSSNYSGAGFSGMRFRFHGMARADFDVWLAKARIDGGGALDRARYLELAKPSENVAPMSFDDVDPDLFRRIVSRCVEEGRMCTDEMAMLDARGGTGFAGTLNTVPDATRQASALGHVPFYVRSFCTVADAEADYGKQGLVLLDPPPPAAPATDGDAKETL